jgi:hypothetical protein
MINDDDANDDAVSKSVSVSVSLSGLGSSINSTSITRQMYHPGRDTRIVLRQKRQWERKETRKKTKERSREEGRHRDGDIGKPESERVRDWASGRETRRPKVRSDLRVNAPVAWTVFLTIRRALVFCV